MALFRRSGEGKRVLRKDRTGHSPVVVGAVLLALVGAGSYLGFTKHIPFTHGFRLKAVFASANSIRKNSPVRIAGVNVGKVKKIERQPGSTAAIVTMELQKDGLPIHADATAKIRPRIFLEGNFFVDLHPGTPATPTLHDSDTLPMTHTTDPVQFGDVLTALQGDTRRSLQVLLQEYGAALTGRPTAADNAQADPAVRGLSAAQALNKSITSAGPALKNASIVNHAFLGTSPHDLRGVIRGLSKITTALESRERQLQDFVSNFNTTMAAFASENTNLRSTIRLLAPTLVIANRTLDHLNADFPNVRAFAREILPGVRETPATIKAAFPWIAETRKLLSRNELRGVVQQLSPATRDLSKTINATVALLPQTDLFAKCLTKVILPTGDIKLNDGFLSTGVENYKEFWYTMVGLAGEGQNFDANGMMVRFQPGGGTQTISTGPGSLSGEALFGHTTETPLGNRPVYTNRRPPYRPDVPCYTQPVPDLNAAPSGPADTNAPAPGTTGEGGGTTIPGTGITLPIGRSTTRSAPQGGSVTGQLLDRLNPFRTTGGGRQR
ncbi:MAG TPA: MlaD family protein [Solirubrobacteraceae bacterium]